MTKTLVWMDIRRKHFGWEVVADISPAREEVEDVICVEGENAPNKYIKTEIQMKIKEYKTQQCKKKWSPLFWPQERKSKM